VAQVTAEDMPVPGSNPLAQLQGKVPGANIVSASGRPGTAPAVILRGPQSINASGRGQDPLYIIDGVISQGGIQDINPQDIENVEVVKGAAASSLYGSRAGNGVIQITTKSGKNAGEGVRFRSLMEYGQSDIENEYLYPRTHFMLMNEDYSRYCVTAAGAPDCARTVDIEQEAYRVNDQGTFSALTPANFVNDAGIARNPGALNARSLYQTTPFVRSYNPIQQVLTNGKTWNGTFDATGRVARTNFFASANQFRQEGAVRFMRGYTRTALRLNVDQQLASSWGRLFIRTNVMQQGAQNENPMITAEQFQPLNRIGRFLGQVTSRWQPLTWVDVEGNFGFDTRSNHSESKTEKGYRCTTCAAANVGSIGVSSNRSYSINASTDITARGAFFTDRLNARLSFRGLYEAQDDRGVSGSGSTIVVPGLNTINSTLASTRGASNYNQTVRQIGMFANLDLDWQGKYILSGLVRRDGASLFGSANRWQTYGRGSVAYRLSEESWFGLDFISDLKFRASVGQAGNRPPFGAIFETYSLSAGQIGGLGQIGNPNLAPEVSTETEIGFDLELFNKYGLTVTNAKNVIDGQIMPVPVPSIGGFTSQWSNVGELSNNTFEVSLNIPVIQTRDLNYSVRLNYDRTTSEISRLDLPEFFYSAAGQQGSETMFKIFQGGRMGEIFGRRFAKSCSELPAGFAEQCGGPGSQYQTNSDGFIVWTDPRP